MKLAERKPREEFNPTKIYDQTVKYYMDKKGYTKEHANSIAEKVVLRELQRHKERQRKL